MASLLFETSINIYDYILLTIFFKRFWGNYKVNKKVYGCCMIILAITVGIVNISLRNSTANMIVSLSVLFILALQYKKGLKLTLLMVGIYAVVNIICEYLGFTIIIAITNEYDLLSNIYTGNYFVGIIMMKLILAFIIILITKLINFESQVLPGFFNIILFTIPIVSFLILFTFIDSFFVTDESVLITRILGLIGILYINVIIFFIFNKCNEMASEIIEKRLFDQEVKYTDAYYQNMEKTQRELKEIRHNLKNQVISIKHYLKDINIEEADGLINDIAQSIESNTIYTENPVVNSILDGKLSQLTNNNIKVYTKISIPKKLDMSIGDLGIVLGNLIDNAVEANGFIKPPEQKYIDLNLQYKSRCLLLQVSNPTFQNGEINYNVSNKEDKGNHGFGLSSIKKIIKKYNGNIDIEQNGSFIVNAMFLDV